MRGSTERDVTATVNRQTDRQTVMRVATDS